MSWIKLVITILYQLLKNTMPNVLETTSRKLEESENLVKTYF